MKPTPAWFHNKIVDGIQLLQSLHLDGRPASEVVTLTATGWIDVLWRCPIAWDEERDIGRLAVAFFSLARQVDRWPAPKHLLDHLPPVPTVLALGLQRTNISAANRARLAQLSRRLNDRWQAQSHAPMHMRATQSPAGGLAHHADAGMLSAETDTAARAVTAEVQQVGDGQNHGG